VCKVRSIDHCCWRGAHFFGFLPSLLDTRPIDDKLSEKLRTRSGEASDGNDRRVDLSFIGHSMGGFVVTFAVRILSDVFSPEAIADLKHGVKELGSEEERQERERRSKIGKSFLLRCLVLVSPDIPAEVLLAGRSNALQSSLIHSRGASFRQRRRRSFAQHFDDR
jgi:Putative serine esterase (DUF676)